MRNIKKVFVLILCICCFTMITIAAQKNKKIEYNDFNKNPLPEIANLEEDFIKIYGVKSSGVVVCFEDKSKFLNGIGKIALENFLLLFLRILIMMVKENCAILQIYIRVLGLLHKNFIY